MENYVHDEKDTTSLSYNKVSSILKIPITGFG